MITESSVEIDAPATEVWNVYADVERWPEWTESVTRVVALDGSGLEVGKHFEITQPKLPRLVWQVTDVDPGRSWTWQQRSPGATTFATHVVVAKGPARTVVRQRLDQRGVLGVLFGVLTRRLTRRYLRIEGEGLKARGEAQRRRDASPA